RSEVGGVGRHATRSEDFAQGALTCDDRYFCQLAAEGPVRAVLTNLGSTGDAQPLLALAVELDRHGHRPILALARIFADRVARLGLDYVPIGPDLSPAEIRSLTLGMMRRRMPSSQI